MNEVCIDVSQLPAPEPMSCIINTLATLNENQFLKVIHRRQPFPLYDKLIANGWYYECDLFGPEEIHLYICKASLRTKFIHFKQ